MGVSKIEKTVYRKLLAEERVVTFGLCAGARGHSDVGYEVNHRVLIFCKRSCFLGRTVETTGQKLAGLEGCDGGAKRGVERACAGDDYPRLGLWGSPSKPEAKTELGCAVNTQIRSVCGCLVCEAARPSRHFRIQSERQHTQRKALFCGTRGLRLPTSSAVATSHQPINRSHPPPRGELFELLSENGSTKSSARTPSSSSNLLSLPTFRPNARPLPS